MSVFSLIKGVDWQFWDSFLKMSKRDKGLSVAFLVVFAPLTYKLLAPAFILLGLSDFTYLINPILLFSGLIIAFSGFIRNVHLFEISLFLLFALTVSVSTGFYLQSAKWVNDNYYYIVYGVAAYYFIGLALDYKRNEQILLFVARMGVCIQIFWQACLLLGLVSDYADTEMGEQMEAAYGFLFPVFFLFIRAFEENSMLDKLFAAISVPLLFFMGARGPVMVFVFFSAGYFLLLKKFKKDNKRKKSLLVLIFVIIFVFLNQIATFFEGIASQIGFSTRIFTSITAGEMTDLENSSERDVIYALILDAILNDESGFGYGFGGDRLFTPNEGYAHNIALEMLCEFGYIGGTIVLLCLIFFWIKCFLKVRKTSSRLFWYIMFFQGVMSLMFSMSWLSYPIFFVFMGYCIFVMRTPRYRL